MVTLIVKDSSEEIIFSMELKGGQNFLDECAENDVDLPFSCHAGACMSCAAQVTKGEAHIEKELDGEKYIETDEDVILTCIAGPKQDSIDSKEKFEIEITMMM
jgi:ferredoxin